MVDPPPATTTRDPRHQELPTQSYDQAVTSLCQAGRRPVTRQGQVKCGWRRVKAFMVKNLGGDRAEDAGRFCKRASLLKFKAKRFLSCLFISFCIEQK